MLRPKQSRYLAPLERGKHVRGWFYKHRVPPGLKTTPRFVKGLIAIEI